MAHSPDKKVKLRAAFIGGLPLEAAADKIGVPLPTARNWYRADKKAGDDWDAYQKASMIVSGGGIEQAMGRIIAAALLRCEALEASIDKMEPIESVKAMATLGDTVSKLRAASKGMMPETDKLGVAMDVLKRQLEFVRARHPRHAAAVAEVLESFGVELARAYG